jgi:hypothetical protein
MPTLNRGCYENNKQLAVFILFNILANYFIVVYYGIGIQGKLEIGKGYKRIRLN